jgi:hypothetical protein
MCREPTWGASGMRFPIVESSQFQPGCVKIFRHLSEELRQYLWSDALLVRVCEQPLHFSATDFFFHLQTGLVARWTRGLHEMMRHQHSEHCASDCINSEKSCPLSERMSLISSSSVGRFNAYLQSSSEIYLPPKKNRPSP